MIHEKKRYRTLLIMATIIDNPKFLFNKKRKDLS